MFLQFFNHLPRGILRELTLIEKSRRGLFEKISEIRLRSQGVSSICIDGERIILAYRAGRDEVEACFKALLSGSLYAHRDTIAEGFISLPRGIRVGVVGQARYEYGKLVGISDVSSLLFRIPVFFEGIEDELTKAFSMAKSGLLIFSPPAFGKTTALRRLAAAVSRGRGGLNAAVIDERREFLPDDYRGCSVDILSGYKKAEGMEIALRTMSPDVIFLDEIGGADEVSRMIYSVNSGVRLVASAHASSYIELVKKANLAPLFERGVFDVFLEIRREGGKRSYKIYSENKREDIANV